MNKLLQDKIPIEMNKVKPDSWHFKKYFFGTLYGIVFIVAIASLMYLWAYFTDISTDYAIIDGQSYIVTSTLNDTLQEILVQENQFVTQGQIVAKMSLANDESAIKQNILQNASLNSANISNKVENIRKLETDIAKRISKLRLEEARKKTIFEQKVHEHAKAQLALRNLSTNLSIGEKMNNNYDLASNNMAKSKKNVDQAKLDFEEASLFRAAIEAELIAMRRQIMLPKSRVDNKANSYLNKLQKIKELALIRSPAEGKVMMIFAKVGQKMIIEQAIMQIVPISRQKLTVIAYFPKKQLESIQLGQKCNISLNLDKQIILQGLVDNVSLEGYNAVSNKGTETQELYPIRIRLAESEAESKNDDLLNIYPGMKASVIVFRNKIFGIF